MSEERTVDDWRDWCTRIKARMDSAEKGWWKLAEKANKMYAIDKPNDGDDNPFNVLYANTEVLIPALYSSTPRPDVSTRYDGQTKSAEAAESMLKVLIDDSGPGLESYDSAMEGAVLSALVPGMGGVRLRAYPDTPNPIRWEEFKYNQFVWGYAKKWSRVPWIAFLHPMTKDEIVKQFDLTDEDAAKVGAKSQSEEDQSSEHDNPPYYVYELWIKNERRTVWLCDEYEDKLLQDVTDDPLKLQGFFPTPGPLTLVRKPTDLDPTPIYEYYRKQAEELNRVTVRLNKVLEALKVRGVYNSMIGNDLEKLLDNTTMENGLAPSNTPMALDGKGFEANIWMLPLDKLIVVAQQLYAARTQIMGVIQQITGLSDIVRGATVASETATAQELKNKWGGIRLRRMQKIVGVYARDLLRIGVDAATTIIPPEMWRKMTGIQLPLQKEQDELKAKVQQIMQQYAQQQHMAQLTGQQPPPPPPPPTPEMQQALTSPTWEQILAPLKDDTSRYFIIDIENASTVDADATADKQDAVEFMTAFAQLLPGIQPLVQLGPTGLNAAKAIVAAVCKRFRLGREVEEALIALQPPPPQPNPVEAMKLQIANVDLQAKQMDLEGKKVEFGVKQADAAHRTQEIQMKSEAARLHHAMTMQKLGAETQQTVVEGQVDMAKTAMEAQANAQAHADRMEHLERQNQVRAAQAHAAKQSARSTANGSKPRKP